MYYIYIDKELIPQDHIIKYPEITEKILYKSSSDKIIAMAINVTLLNYEGIYNRYTDGSIFYNNEFYNKELIVYDEDTNMYVFIGRIKNIEYDENTVTIFATNYIKDIADKQLYYLSTAQVTPAEHIYKILTENVGMEPIYINKTSFDLAISQQSAASCYCDVQVTLEQNLNCLQVIEELLKLCACELYYYNNLISIYSFEVYNGIGGLRIEEYQMSDVKLSTEIKVYNGYSIAYKSGTTIAYQSTDYSNLAKLEISRERFGEKYLIIPEQKPETTVSSEIPVLLQSANAAKYCGNVNIDRYCGGLHLIEFVMDYDYIQLITMNDIILVNYKDLIYEPCRVKAIERYVQSKTIRLYCELCNYPNLDYARDTTRPATIEILDIIQISNYEANIIMSYTNEDNIFGIEIAFSKNNLDYESEYLSEGGTPLLITNYTLKDGNIYIKIHGFEFTTYYFKARQIKTNMVSGYYSDVFVYTFENQLITINNAFNTNYNGQYIYYDATNPKNGERTLQDYNVFVAKYGYVYGTYDVSNYYCLNYCFCGKMHITLQYNSNKQYCEIKMELDENNIVYIYNPIKDEIILYDHSCTILYADEEIIFYFDGMSLSNNNTKIYVR